jgi:hypothetical protein
MNDQIKEFLATVPEADGVPALESAPSVAVSQSWARRETLRRANGQLWGCWANNFSSACSATAMTAIEQGAILFEQAAGTCGSGSTIWVVTHS